MRLLPPTTGHRDMSLVRGYGKDLEAFAETYTLSPELRLAKKRFKKYHEFWDGWSSGEASDEFADRLSEQGTDAENSEGEPTVTTKDNQSVVSRQGLRRGGTGGTAGGCSADPPATPAPAARERRGSGRPGRRRDLVTSGSPDRRRRSRSERSRRRGDRSRRRRGESVEADAETEAGDDDAADRNSVAASRRRGHGQGKNLQQSSPKANSPGGPGGRVPSSSPPAATASRSKAKAQNLSQSQSELDFNKGGGSGSSGGRPSHRQNKKAAAPSGKRNASSGSQVLEVADETDDDQPLSAGPTFFLGKKTALKKELDAEFKKRGLKTYAVPALKQICQKLSEADQIELKKTGDAEPLVKNHVDALKRLKELEVQLTDVDTDPPKALKAFVRSACLLKASKRPSTILKEVFILPLKLKGLVRSPLLHGRRGSGSCSARWTPMPRRPTSSRKTQSTFAIRPLGLQGQGR